MPEGMQLERLSMNVHQTRQPAASDDIDVAALWNAVSANKTWLLAAILGAGIATFIVLSFITPRYASVARVLIENDETVFTRPASDATSSGRSDTLLDREAVRSQVQVLQSRDLALEVALKLGLNRDSEFIAEDAEPGWLKRIFYQLGILEATPEARRRERMLDKFESLLSVSEVSDSRVIDVEFSSEQALKAANVANGLAEAYLTWQQKERLKQTQDASRWLSEQIAVLRRKVAQAEAKVEEFRGESGLVAGPNAVSLNAQQLSELNSQLILAKAQRSEAEARAELIQNMLDNGGSVDSAPDVLRSELIQRLQEQRVRVQRRLSEASATLLPSHPRVKQLNSELAGVQRQIREEARKVVFSLQNEAKIAGAREASLRESLNDMKKGAARAGQDEITLRALERDAKVNRDLLESYLARHRDASGRRDAASVPAHATIISRAHASSTPSYPRKWPITFLVMGATALLGLAFVLARALHLGDQAPGQSMKLREPVWLRRKLSDAMSAAVAKKEAFDAARSSAASPESAAQSASADTESPPSGMSLRAIARRLGVKASGRLGHRVLITGASDSVDAAEEAVQIARTLAAGREKVVLVDLSERTPCLSDHLGIDRMPGIRELAEGSAQFEQVIKRDPEGALQVITAGHPRIASLFMGEDGTANRILQALDQTYNCVLYYADAPVAAKLSPGFIETLGGLVLIGEEPTGDRAAADGLAGGAGTETMRFWRSENAISSLMGSWSFLDKLDPRKRPESVEAT